MNQDQIFEQIKKKRSFLCVGLDTDIKKIPEHLLDNDDPVFAFNREIIDATVPFAIAFKPNLAFYESLGSQGWQSLEKTVNYVKSSYPDVFLIADAKRGDIGNTSQLYARAFFETMGFDAVTTAPYMGEDSVKPFMIYPGKWIILLALTSNKGAADFQFIKDKNDDLLFENVLRISQKWGSPENMMYVVGATQAEKLREVREIVPGHFLLVPGVGAQGGSLGEVARYGMNRRCGLIVNSSRGIIYASPDRDFALHAESAARRIRDEMDQLLDEYGITG